MGILLNVSFGIYVFHPLGWAFMVVIAAIECVLLSKLIAGSWWSGRVGLMTLSANAVSGLIGIALSLWHNGGWWLVCWLPWVGSNEFDRADELGPFAVYYFIAFMLTLVIETPFLLLVLRKRAPNRTIVRASVTANIVSYLFASVLMYGVMFNTGHWH